MDKIKALKENNESFDAYLNISEKALSSLFWWIGNVHSQKRIMDHGNSDILITTDASPKGGVLFVINVVQEEDGVLIKYRIISIFFKH